MSNKAKTVRKPMSQQTKRNLANIFGSIISNQRAIDGAKELPIWVALIFFVISVFLPVIPYMVQTSGTYGASFVDTYTYSLDRTLPIASLEMQKNGIDFKVQDKKLQYYKNNEPQVVPNYELLYSYVNKATNEYNLMVYYSNENTTDLKLKCNETYYKRYSTDSTTKDDENKYCPSFMILAPDEIFIFLYKEGTATAASGTYNGCNWNNYKSVDDLLVRVTNIKESSNIGENLDAIFANWKDVFNESYLDAKSSTLLNGTFIYLGIFAALVLFMGLMIFLLTRGKHNVFRYLSILTCLKIAAWASFTPGIIGMILGFIFPQQATLFFIMVLGIRIMWLCMKQLRPQQYN